MKNYYCVQPAKFRLDGGAMYGIIPKPLWEKASPPDQQNRIDLALRLVLIEQGPYKVLIDTGIGDYHGEKFDQRFDVRGEKNPLLNALSKNKIGPEDITDLILSHLHFDHAGGIAYSKDGIFHPLFPKATLHLHKKHYEYSLRPTKRDGGSFHPNVFEPTILHYINQQQINWLEGEEGVIISDLNLNFVLSHGHTPYLLHPYDEKFIYLADIVPTSNHVSTAWVMGYDISPGVSVEDKERILKMVMEKNLTVIYEHDPLYLGSKVAQDPKKGLKPYLPISQKDELIYSLDI